MKPRRVVISATMQPMLDAMLDRVLVAQERPDFPEFGLAPCRPGEMLEITIRRVMPGEIRLVRSGRTFAEVKADRAKRGVK